MYFINLRLPHICVCSLRILSARAHYHFCQQADFLKKENVNSVLRFNTNNRIKSFLALVMPFSVRWYYHGICCTRDHLRVQSQFQYLTGRYYQRRHVSFSENVPASRYMWENIQQSYIESENEYFHSFLESTTMFHPYLLGFRTVNHGCVNNYINSISKDVLFEMLNRAADKTQPDRVQNLLFILEYWAAKAAQNSQDITKDLHFNKTVQLLGRNLQNMSPNQIIESMVLISQLDFRKNSLVFDEARKNRILLSKYFDDECCKRLQVFQVKELLLAADFFYVMRGSLFASFPHQMLERMKALLHILTKPELLLLLYHANLTRKTPPGLLEDVTNHLTNHFDSMSLNELAVVNQAHYKTCTKVQQPAFFMALSHQLEICAQQDINPICLSALFKYQHHSMNSYKVGILPQFFSTMQKVEKFLLPRIPTVPPETLTHILRIYFSMEIISEDLLVAVFERIAAKGVSDWR